MFKSCLSAIAPVIVLSSMPAVAAQTEAALFGAREGAEQVSLSPDGSKIAFVAPNQDQGATLYTVSTTPGDTPKPALMVSNPDLFKAVTAVAPVTDLALLRDANINFSNYRVTADYLGEDVRAGSPAQNARAIKAPVLLAHGTLDRNVTYNQATYMRDRLVDAGAKPELLTFAGLDHGLEDGGARAALLEKADALFRSIAPSSSGSQVATAATR